MLSLRHNTKKPVLYVLTLTVLLFSLNVVAAGSFGRFFTTPKQRKQIEELRAAGPAVTVNITEAELTVDEGTKQAEKEAEVLMVKGLVYRNSGKNTAWVNESNTYEGDISSQYITIRETGVEKNAVVIDLHGNNTGIKLRVGEKYNPDTRGILDITDYIKEVFDKAKGTQKQVDE